jgi:hypothetical protein
MYSSQGSHECEGFPIRKSPDQSLLSSSPKHIAACRVLHRLLMPRHPPNALSSLFLSLVSLLDRVKATCEGHLKLNLTNNDTSVLRENLSCIKCAWEQHLHVESQRS